LDNASPDHTSDVVGEFEHPGLRYVQHSENIGAHGNFVACLEEARGEYLLILHDDDLIDLDFVETCIRALQGRQAAFVRTGTRVIDDGGAVLGSYPNRAGAASGRDHVRSWFRKEVFWSFCSTLLHVDSLRTVGAIPSDFFLNSDAVIFSKLALRFDGVAVPEVKASQRTHGDEISYRTSLSEWVGEGRRLLRLIDEEWGEAVPSGLHYEGRRFLSDIYYRFAAGIDNPRKRVLAYLKVWMGFGVRYVPPGMLSWGRCVLRPGWGRPLSSRHTEPSGSLPS
jgi:GT2 family glycosyltransferase